MNDNPTPLHIDKSIGKAQLADRYGLSDKQFRSRCRRAGVLFTGTMLMPAQIAEIVKKLGPWQITIHEP